MDNLVNITEWSPQWNNIGLVILSHIGPDFYFEHFGEYCINFKYSIVASEKFDVKRNLWTSVTLIRSVKKIHQLVKSFISVMSIMNLETLGSNLIFVIQRLK